MPRAGLTETRVVEEAERLADEVGLSKLTLATLADRLGVRQPSLYKHVTGMDGLKRSIALGAKRELGEVLGRAAVGRARGDAVVSLSHAYRAWAKQHPGRYEAAQRAPLPGDVEDEQASNDVVRVASDVMAGYELRDDDAVDAIRALRSALHGFVTLETGGGFALPVDIDRSFDRLVSGLALAFSRWGQEAVAEGP
ncbi:MAG: TetR family transcriptional regulator [Acidimicrobiaceae bacterium]|nr:TetR family transcriptional regulator [Acidimicrobiaceae bacterium]